MTKSVKGRPAIHTEVVDYKKPLPSSDGEPNLPPTPSGQRFLSKLTREVKKWGGCDAGTAAEPDEATQALQELRNRRGNPER